MVIGQWLAKIAMGGGGRGGRSVGRSVGRSAKPSVTDQLWRNPVLLWFTFKIKKEEEGEELAHEQHAHHLIIYSVCVCVFE